MHSFHFMTAVTVLHGSMWWRTVQGQNCTELPDLPTLLERAFPTWNVNESTGERIAGGGKWNPKYYTKKFDGLDPDLGGYPTDFDVGYPFLYPAPFFGQPGGGTPHHCPENAPVDIKIQSCPIVVTDNDYGPNGPGHIAPPITLAALRQAIRDDCPTNEDIKTWFDYDQYQCLIKPEVLLGFVRRYYPRDVNTGVVTYPSDTDPNSTAYYELNFPSPQGPPHYCSDAFIEADQWADFCPYVHEGDNAGKYRHPHITITAVQQYLANMIMPDDCGEEWRPLKGVYPETSFRDMSIVFPVMESDDPKAQPMVPYSWPETSDRKRKAPLGTFPLYLVLQENTAGSNSTEVEQNISSSASAVEKAISSSVSTYHPAVYNIVAAGLAMMLACI